MQDHEDVTIPKKTAEIDDIGLMQAQEQNAEFEDDVHIVTDHNRKPSAVERELEIEELKRENEEYKRRLQENDDRHQAKVHELESDNLKKNEENLELKRQLADLKKKMAAKSRSKPTDQDLTKNRSIKDFFLPS